jgi:hypothetical protein
MRWRCRAEPAQADCGLSLSQAALPVTEQSSRAGAVNGLGVEQPRPVGHAMADADQPSPRTGICLSTSGALATGGAVRQTARPDVGRFVGLFRQPTSGFWRFVAVRSPATQSAESP